MSATIEADSRLFLYGEHRRGSTNLQRILEHLTAADVQTHELSLPASLEIERHWRAIYGKAFAGRPRLRKGVSAEAAYSQIECVHYWIIPFNSNLPGTPVRVARRGQSGVECHGKMVPLGLFCSVEFFVSPIDLEWTMVHTHEDHASGGPYFIRSDWVKPWIEVNRVNVFKRNR